MRRPRLVLLLVLGMLTALLPLGAAPAVAADDHLLMTEIVVTPTEGEFVEIHNPTASAIDLTDYYFTDATFAGGLTYYYNIVTGSNAGGGGFGDFHSRFPAGSSIAPGEYQTIALTGSIDFVATYGIAPTYELFEDDAAADAVPDMLEATVGSINAQGGLSNGGEFVVIYTWDGASDLVTDVDYAVWGDKVEAVDKTDIAIDGPDADTDTTTYAADTPIASQAIIAAAEHANGQSWQRNDLTEGAELGTGGNGTGGDDETSEDTNVTWSTAVPTPGAGVAPPALPDIWINEVDADTPGNDTAEFIELYDGGVGNASLAGYSIVMFNGSDSLSYTPAFDLDGFSTDADGYFVIGSVPGADIDVSPGGSGWLQNGADAVALIAGDAADFPNDTAVPTSGVVDALVYDTSDADAVDLLPLLNAGQAQINEGGSGDKDNHSNQRCPDGSGDLRNTDTYTQFVATPRSENCVVPPLTPELVINEIMNNPAAVGDAAGEWFEIYNASAADVDIDGWTISDNDTDSHVISNASPLLVPAGGYLVLGNNTDSLTNGGAFVSYSYGASWFLANGGDEVVLTDGDANEVDRVVYDGGPSFPDLTGASMALIDPALDNNDGANWCQSGTAFGDGDLGSPGAVNDCIPPDPTDYKIHEIQGAGAASPKQGEIVTVEAVVVADYQQDDLYPSAEYDTDIDGYFLQEEDADADADALTSEGIFVRDNDNAVNVGDVVRVTGTVAESFGLTRIESVSLVEVLTVDPAPAVTPANVTLPVANIADLEAFEGMSILLPQALVISEYFNFDRFNEVVLTTERASQPTAVEAPGSAAAAALADLNVRSRITVDDARGGSNNDPAMHPDGDVFDLSHKFRGGDTLQNLAGVMDFSFGLYRVQPTTGGDYAVGNPRPTSPDPVGGDLKVATFNVLNYFTTLDESGAECFPSFTRNDCRGADNATEFERQRTKIIDAIVTMDADVVGLMEIENDTADVAVSDLTAGLNDATAPGTYANIVTGPVGPDAIRVALVYQTASVTPYGAHAVLEGEFLDPNNIGDDKNRAALAQSFLNNANGGVFTVAVNHLKSKGSGCGAGDDDPEQGSCNLTRTLAAEILADWLQTDPTGSGDSDYLIIGDLNSYDMEDPISALKARGYTDLILRDIGPDAYSYVFSGQWGYLDYIMANAAVASQVTGTTVWHINADEPDILDYDTSFKQDAQDALYEPNAFRSSDHDPVIAGLDVTVTPMQAKEHSLTVLEGLLPTGNRRDDNRINKAIKNIGDSLNPAYWVDDFHLSDKGKKVFNEEKKAVKDLMKVRTVDVDGVIDALVDADEILAGTAIADAIARGGDADNIARAQHEMEEAAEDVAIGRPDHAIDHYRKAWQWAQKALEEVPPRFATFNASLNRFNAGDLINDLSDPFNAQAQTIAEIIQRNRPDVLLVNEFDYDVDGIAAGLFQDNYLSIGQNGADPIVYPYRYVAASNTGIASGFDFDNNGNIGGGNDAFGFGFFEGQFAFVVYSMHPINYDKIRTFQNFLWKDMPGALLPDDPATAEPADWYSPEELDVFRLSSKNHVDVPIRIHGETIHFLVSHPTPPVFDGPEDRNGTRNFDEIRFWADYATGGKSARYIYDDNGKKGGLSNGARFVIAGDLNSDPLDGDSIPGAAQQLLEHPRVNVSQTPSSLGGPEQALLTRGLNLTHLSDPAYDTADFNDAGPGNLRADYVLPSSNLGIVDSAVFWPEVADPLFPLVGTFPFPSSDHRLVWVDVDVHGPDHDDDDDDDDDDDQQPT